MYPLNLPVVGPNGSSISWDSSKPEILSPSGSVNRPAFSLFMGHAPVTLTATVSRRDTTQTKVYEVKVKKRINKVFPYQLKITPYVYIHLVVGL